ncbi:MAG: MlaE family ABC transporter permease [Janthinobacterium lividum]
MTSDTVPGLHLETLPSGRTARLSGNWTALALAHHQQGAARDLMQQLNQLSAAAASWDLTAIARLDHVGGQLLWRVWQRRLPNAVSLTAAQREIFERIELLDGPSDLARPHSPMARVTQTPAQASQATDPFTRLGLGLFSLGHHLYDGVALAGGCVLDFGDMLRRPRRAPWTEISANLYAAGTRALPITALVAFLIGVVLSYLSAQQLAAYGASGYIVNILGLAIVRELGPVLAAVLVAGRSGSAITAQLGVMRVTEELDAMRVMGIEPGRRLVLPRVLALAVAMPLLVMWTDIVALLGGMVSAKLSLGIEYADFLRALRHAVSIVNLLIGLGKGVAFGMLIALVACHFGLRIQANARSLGQGTTAAVVTSITVVIFADAIFAIIFQNVGMP